MFPGSHPTNKADLDKARSVISFEKVKVEDDVVIKNGETKNCVKRVTQPGVQDILEDPDFVCDEDCRKTHESLKKLLIKPNKLKSKGDLLASHVHGRVKWYDTRLEYGFITRADTGEDVFLHVTGIMDIRPSKYLRDVGRDEVSLDMAGFIFDDLFKFRE